MLQYAADHVRKQLATHLETKIRVLKYLSKRDAPKRERIKYFLSQVTTSRYRVGHLVVHYLLPTSN